MADYPRIDVTVDEILSGDELAFDHAVILRDGLDTSSAT